MKHEYDPSLTETKWYAEWQKSGLFRPRPPSSGKESFTIVIPPPNVTGILHIGHVLNNTLQDILIRFKRIQGFQTLWLPGTDHAGIATQNKVEQRLASEGKSKHDLGRDAFIEQVWEWKKKHGGIIIEQLKRLGCSCDWDRERFTLDPGLSRAVREVFTRLFEKDLIYKGKYIVNWCPRCVTALSDEEVNFRNEKSHLWYIHYPIEHGGKGVVVATTRPETMLGDTAVAVHPDDDRYRHLIGQNVLLPLKNILIPVIADEMVDRAFGTGAVKITPAHDPNDFEAGRRHNLDMPIVIDEHGKMNANAGPAYNGMTREACRKQVIIDLEKGGFLVKTEPHEHAVGLCYRCECVVEPYLSSQWFVRMQPLAQRAIDVAQNGEIVFYPDRWTKVYLHWLENIRDWCISRQLWWGHRIPVWTCESCGHYQAYREDPETCPACGSSRLIQDPDVLDTWFSSWLWPFSTLGWPDETDDLKTFYPTDTLITAPEIIFFWVARMIMAGLEFMDTIPFKKIYLHGTVRDPIGRKMSKSLGNSPDPLDIIDKYGADALRFSIVMISPRGSDIFFSEDSLNAGRTFANKIQNAARLIISNCPQSIQGNAFPHSDTLRYADRWILYRMAIAADEMMNQLEEFRFNDAAVTIHRFFWHEFCDWYLEIAKAAIYDKTTPEHKASVQTNLVNCLATGLQLLHPFMPFITEDIWNTLFVNPISIMISPWQDISHFLKFKTEADSFEIVQRTIIHLRTMRAEIGIPPGKELHGIIAAPNAELLGLLESNRQDIVFLARLGQLDINTTETVVPPSIRSTSLTEDGIDVYLDLEGIVDVPGEVARLQKEIQKTGDELKKVIGKLSNASFMDKAPEDVVEKTRRIHLELSGKLEKLTEALARLIRS
ncbi:valine--tRNA ligase [bacterium]|nr:valine--tRNA ligase [candidate division CSSED10-310 bacterium]